MRSSTTRSFRKLFEDLPQQVKETAKKNYALWKENPFHPSREFKDELCGQCPSYKFHPTVEWALPTSSQPVANTTIPDRHLA
jgi:hypothetical protein